MSLFEYKPLTKEDERIQLYRHGTKPCDLTAKNIVQTAEADMRAKNFNREIRAKRQNKTDYPIGSTARKMLPQYRRYGFVDRHVSEAKSARHLIELALKDRGPGQISKYLNTIMIYDNADRLREALEILEGES